MDMLKKRFRHFLRALLIAALGLTHPAYALRPKVDRAGLEEKLAPAAGLEEIEAVPGTAKVSVESLTIPRSITGMRIPDMNLVRDILEVYPDQMVVGVWGSSVIDPKTIRDVDLVLYFDETQFPEGTRTAESLIFSHLREYLLKRYKGFRSTVADEFFFRGSKGSLEIAITVRPISDLPSLPIVFEQEGMIAWGFNPLLPHFSRKGSRSARRFQKVTKAIPDDRLHRWVMSWYRSLLKDYRLKAVDSRRIPVKAYSRLAMAAYAVGNPALARRIKRGEITPGVLASLEKVTDLHDRLRAVRAQVKPAPPDRAGLEAAASEVMDWVLEKILERFNKSPEAMQHLLSVEVGGPVATIGLGAPEDQVLVNLKDSDGSFQVSVTRHAEIPFASLSQVLEDSVVNDVLEKAIGQWGGRWEPPLQESVPSEESSSTRTYRWIPPSSQSARAGLEEELQGAGLEEIDAFVNELAKKKQLRQDDVDRLNLKIRLTTGHADLSSLNTPRGQEKLEELIGWINAAPQQRADPAPYQHLDSFIYDFNDWNLDLANPVTIAALSHWLLTSQAIPYTSHNTRTGWALMNIILLQGGVITEPLQWELSWENDYYAALDKHGTLDPRPFIRFVEGRVKTADLEAKRTTRPAAGEQPAPPDRAGLEEVAKDQAKGEEPAPKRRLMDLPPLSRELLDRRRELMNLFAQPLPPRRVEREKQRIQAFNELMEEIHQNRERFELLETAKGPWTVLSYESVRDFARWIRQNDQAFQELKNTAQRLTQGPAPLEDSHPDQRLVQIQQDLEWLMQMASRSRHWQPVAERFRLLCIAAGGVPSPQRSTRLSRGVRDLSRRRPPIVRGRERQAGNPPLIPQEEIPLSPEESVFREYLPLMEMLSARYARRYGHGSDPLTFLSSAAQGFQETLEKYPPSHPDFWRFVTTRMRQRILDQIREEALLPRKIAEDLKRLRQAEERLFAEGNAHPTTEELAQASGFSLARIIELRRAESYTGALRLSELSMESQREVKSVPDEGQSQREERKQNRTYARKLLEFYGSDLEPWERFILEKRYLDPTEPTVQEIAASLGIPVNLVYQLDQSALGKLKRRIADQQRYGGRAQPFSAGLESNAGEQDRWKQVFFSEIEQLLGDSDLTLPLPLRRAFETVDRGQFFPGRSWIGHTAPVMGDPPNMPQGTEPRLIAWMILQALSPDRLERLLADHPADPVKVLVEGAGSGYSTAVLDEYLNNVLGPGRYRIVAVEVNPLYYRWAAERLGDNLNVQLIQN
ncbi:MAG: sigma-70 family RNA polymerase sigma factor, partial [Candidatus Omnitrophica bacterium]|nr:sigma-70 family RNA polymerase sigma factor [Candidatus Omnitrophota bacterium]